LKLPMDWEEGDFDSSVSGRERERELTTVGSRASSIHPDRARQMQADGVHPDRARQMAVAVADGVHPDRARHIADGSNSGGGGASSGGSGHRRQDNFPLPSLFSVHKGQVQKIESFGAFVEMAGYRKNGLVHISQISSTRVENVAEVLAMGEIGSVLSSILWALLAWVDIVYAYCFHQSTSRSFRSTMARCHCL
jgi:hypothetical protein